MPWSNGSRSKTRSLSMSASVTACHEVSAGGNGTALARGFSAGAAAVDGLGAGAVEAGGAEDFVSGVRAIAALRSAGLSDTSEGIADVPGDDGVGDGIVLVSAGGRGRFICTLCDGFDVAALVRARYSAAVPTMSQEMSATVIQPFPDRR